MTEQESAHPTSSELSELTTPLKNGGDGSDLITAHTTQEGSSSASAGPQPSLLPAVPQTSSTATIASSFSASTSALPQQHGGEGKIGTAPQGHQYPPSPHASSAVQPPSNPYPVLGFHQDQVKQVSFCVVFSFVFLCIYSCSVICPPCHITPRVLTLEAEIVIKFSHLCLLLKYLFVTRISATALKFDSLQIFIFLCFTVWQEKVLLLANWVFHLGKSQGICFSPSQAIYSSPLLVLGKHKSDYTTIRGPNKS